MDQIDHPIAHQKKVATFHTLGACFEGQAVCNLTRPVHQAGGDSTVFCPNCGTKNDDSAQKCSQCGFDQKPKGAASKHKGTVMMTGSPAAKLGADKPKPNPTFKGTMVGVAPADVSRVSPTAAKPAVNPGTKASNPNLKGTMVGVAPPGVGDSTKQAAASSAAAQSAAKSPPANLKGTMIGLAPPNMGAEVEAAKAKLAAKKTQAAEATKGAHIGAATPPAPTLGAAKKAPPSQLKGTMIGVAPPDVQAQFAAAKGTASAKNPSKPSLEPPVPDKEPPSEPDPLGGTVVGTSPFGPGGPHAAMNPHGGGLDFNDDTPSESGAPVTTPGAMTDGGTPAAEHPAIPIQTTAVQTTAVQATAVQTTAMRGAEPSPHQALADESSRLPMTKSSKGPTLLVVVLLLIVAAGVGFLVMSKGDAGENDASDKATSPTPDVTPE